jgi:HlyD family secretion protein
MFPPIAEISDTALYYLPSMRKSGFHIYYLMIFFVFAGLASLFLIHVYIAVQAPGIVRPAQERTNIKSLVSGTIDSLYYKEGESVGKNEIILSIRDEAMRVKRRVNEEEMTVQQNFIHDLLILTMQNCGPDQVAGSLYTTLYQEQARRFFSRETEHLLNLKKANREEAINALLVKDKVISPKEFFDAQILQARMKSAYNAFRGEQYTAWQQELADCRLRFAELLTQHEEFQSRKESYCIRAPVSGSLQGLVSRYAGTAVQQDETICSVSPDGQLVGECYVSTRDIGMLKPGQRARFQIDAFSYRYFGIIEGSVLTIDNDFTMMEGKPFFKIVCRFDGHELKLKHGYTGQLKKGMGFTARFVINRRTLWQLLYDGLDEWLNPAASPIRKA